MTQVRAILGSVHKGRPQKYQVLQEQLEHLPFVHKVSAFCSIFRATLHGKHALIFVASATVRFRVKGPTFQLRTSFIDAPLASQLLLLRGVLW